MALVVVDACGAPLTPNSAAGPKPGALKRYLLLGGDVKAMKGTLDVGDPREWWKETIDALALQPLSPAWTHRRNLSSDSPPSGSDSIAL